MINNPDPNIGAIHLEQHFNCIQEWSRQWRIKLNEKKSVQVTFTKYRGTSATFTLNGQILPLSDNIKYLGIHLDKGLRFEDAQGNKRKQLGVKLSKYHWLINY